MDFQILILRLMIFLFVFFPIYIFIKNFWLEGNPIKSSFFTSSYWKHPDGTISGFPPEKILHRFTHVGGGGYVWIFYSYRLRARYYILSLMISLTFSGVTFFLS